MKHPIFFLEAYRLSLLSQGTTEWKPSSIPESRISDGQSGSRLRQESSKVARESGVDGQQILTARVR
jgi:hypothetical protein